MSRRAARVKLCPTPSKGRHYTEADAIATGQRMEAQLEHAHLPVVPFYTYQCPCRCWHLTHQPHDRDGVPHRRAIA